MVLKSLDGRRAPGGPGIEPRWTTDDWQHSTDTPSQATAVGIDYADVHIPTHLSAPIRFTFLWLDENLWEGQDYIVEIEEPRALSHTRAIARRKRKARGKYASKVT